MEYIELGVDIALILISIICIQSKRFQEFNQTAASIAFTVSLGLFTLLGVSSLILKVNMDQTLLDAASGLALIYIGSLYYVCTKEKKKVGSKS